MSAYKLYHDEIKRKAHIKRRKLPRLRVSSFSSSRCFFLRRILRAQSVRRFQQTTTTTIETTRFARKFSLCGEMFQREKNIRSFHETSERERSARRRLRRVNPSAFAWKSRLQEFQLLRHARSARRRLQRVNHFAFTWKSGLQELQLMRHARSRSIAMNRELWSPCDSCVLRQYDVETERRDMLFT